jgi:hypothetical protein
VSDPAKEKARYQSPEYKEKARIRGAAYRARPDIKAKAAAYRASPEVRAREAARKRSAHFKELQRIRDASEAARARARRNYLANREKTLAAIKRWQREHPEKVREYRRRMAKNNPVIALGGERFRLNELPEELRPVALLIRETRLELKARNQK